MKLLKKSNLEAWYKTKNLGPDRIIELLEQKQLTGRGGACFPTGSKWKSARDAKADCKYVICNADEGEPGTFKDKFLFDHVPQNVIEGIMIAAYCIGAKHAFIYLRGEYFYLKKKLQKVINQVTKKSNSGIKVDIVEGAGAYICGDETTIIASIEHKRGYPHFKPPYPTQEGLYNKPTVINNVETLATIPILLLDESWNNSIRLWSISGDVSKPGVYELEVGSNLGQVARLVGAKDPKAVYFGASGGCLKYRQNFIVNQAYVCQEDVSLGACSLIFVGQKRNMLDMAINLSHFFCHESCGKCTPCREGNVHILNFLEKIRSGKATKKDLDLLLRLSSHIKDTAFCGLGQTCTNHVMNALKYFREDFKVK